MEKKFYMLTEVTVQENGSTSSQIVNSNYIPKEYTEEDMEQMYDIGRYDIIHKNTNSTFQTAIEVIKRKQNETHTADNP